MSDTIIEDTPRAKADLDAQASSPNDLKPKKGSRRPLIFALILLVVAVVAGSFYLLNRNRESTDDAFIEAHVMDVSPQIAGVVKRVLVDDNQEVKAGDLLIELDPRDNQATYAQARANLNSAQAKLGQAQAQLASSRADLAEADADAEEARANAVVAEKEYVRQQELRQRQVASQQEFDTADATAKANKAALESKLKHVVSVQSTVYVNDAAVKSAVAQVELAEALLETTNLRLSYTKIAAPQDGRVTRKSIEPGNYVQAGTNMMTIVPHESWVVANFKETQLDDMRIGQGVDIKVDAYPSLKLRGRVDSFQKGTGARFSLLPSENATGNYVKVVQRVPVKIVFVDPPKDAGTLLAAGMSVVPTVRTGN